MSSEKSTDQRVLRKRSSGKAITEKTRPILKRLKTPFVKRSEKNVKFDLEKGNTTGITQSSTRITTPTKKRKMLEDDTESIEDLARCLTNIGFTEKRRNIETPHRRYDKILDADLHGLFIVGTSDQREAVLYDQITRLRRIIREIPVRNPPNQNNSNAPMGELSYFT